MGLANQLHKAHNKWHQARSITATSGRAKVKYPIKNVKNSKNLRNQK